MNIKQILLTLVAGATLVSHNAFAAETASPVSLRTPTADEIKLEGRDVVIYLNDKFKQSIGAVRVTIQGNANA